MNVRTFRHVLCACLVDKTISKPVSSSLSFSIFQSSSAKAASFWSHLNSSFVFCSCVDLANSGSPLALLFANSSFFMAISAFRGLCQANDDLYFILFFVINLPSQQDTSSNTSVSDSRGGLLYVSGTLKLSKLYTLQKTGENCSSIFFLSLPLSSRQSDKNAILGS